VSGRPPVSVVVPFRGDRGEAETLAAALRALETGPGDEVIVADNTDDGLVAGDGRTAVVRVPGTPSARRARNDGARDATNSWLLFLDADCRAVPALLDLFFSPEPDERCGVVAGEVAGEDSQPELLARWARSRRGLMARYHVEGPGRPAGIAGNLLVRREALEQAGGFEEEARSEADVDLCWRIQDAGWTLEYRPAAMASHRDPAQLGAVLRQAWMYGAGRRWLRKRWGSVSPPPIAVPLARAIGGALVWTVTLKFERALFKLIDGLVAVAGWLGYQRARLRM